MDLVCDWQTGSEAENEVGDGVMWGGGVGETLTLVTYTSLSQCQSVPLMGIRFDSVDL